MSGPGLVVHEQALSDVEQALRDATEDLRRFIIDLQAAVDAQTAGWSEETGSRQAQRRLERRLDDGVARLAEALENVAGEVAAHRERAHDAEVENVAIVG